MCIIAFDYNPRSDIPLQIVANRDEFYDRPAKALHEWTVNGTTVFAGQDEKELGTWLGVSETGKFVAITNYRNPKLEQVKPCSRGQIATSFLSGSLDATSFAKQLQHDKDLYGSFNVLLYDRQMLVHFNNVLDEITNVQPGVHGLCNATLDIPWPKVDKLTQRFEQALAVKTTDNELLKILHDETKTADELLPSTGVALSLERALSSIFIRMPNYGTRCSTICRLYTDKVELIEQTFVIGEPGKIVTLDKPLAKKL